MKTYDQVHLADTVFPSWTGSQILRFEYIYEQLVIDVRFSQGLTFSPAVAASGFPFPDRMSVAAKVDARAALPGHTQQRCTV